MALAAYRCMAMALKFTFCVLVYIYLGIGEHLASEPSHPPSSISTEFREDAESLLRFWERDPAEMVEQFQVMQRRVQKLTLQLKDCADRGQLSPKTASDDIEETSRRERGASRIKIGFTKTVSVSAYHH